MLSLVATFSYIHRNYFSGLQVKDKLWWCPSIIKSDQLTNNFQVENETLFFCDQIYASNKVANFFETISHHILVHSFYIRIDLFITVLSVACNPLVSLFILMFSSPQIYLVAAHFSWILNPSDMSLSFLSTSLLYGTGYFNTIL